MVDWILNLDRGLFSLINDANAAWLDPVMIAISYKFAWVPIYIFLLYLIQHKYGWKTALIAVAFVIPMIAASDITASGIMKPFFERLRPCQPESFFSGLVHTAGKGCGGKYGFVSSHSANFFALATFLSVVFRGQPKWFAILFFVAAFLVAYSRVYLGVHYPADVAVGGLLGIVVGATAGWGYKKTLNRIGKPDKA